MIFFTCSLIDYIARKTKCFKKSAGSKNQQSLCPALSLYAVSFVKSPTDI